MIGCPSVPRTSAMSRAQRRSSNNVPISKKAARRRLPVPPLRQTLDRYLESIKPFLLEDERNGGPLFSSSFELRKRWADEFELGVGARLQERLLALDKISPHNWLDDTIWLKKAYLESRSPLLINSNWWLAFMPDLLKPHEYHITEGISSFQLRRAAWLVHRILEFKHKLKTQEIHPETTRTGLWIRDGVASIFGVYRMPGATCDILTSPPPPTEPTATTLIVMVHDWLYSVDTLGALPATLEQRLTAVAADANLRRSQGENAPPIGLLSSDDRSIWAQNIKHLLHISPKNQDTLRTIQQSLFVLCLDDRTHINPGERPQEELELDAHLHAVRSGVDGTARNRWFDKTLNLIVDPSGRAGAMGEHAPCDALVPSIVTEYALCEAVNDAAFLNRDSTGSSGWRSLDWVVDDSIWRACEEAEHRANDAIARSDDSVLTFELYGSDWIKEVARLSPDAYIQMALQLAWYKLRGDFTATYETALTRAFHRGRTETIRTFSVASREWVLAMVNSNSSNEERSRLLQRAIQTHSGLTRDAAVGRGIDRHLLGLRVMHTQGGFGHIGPLFDDNLFLRSQEWKLSTSGLSAGYYFRGTGFGASYPDGYGINYLAGPAAIKFGIESKHVGTSSQTQTLKLHIYQALYEMQLLHSTSFVMPISTL